MKRRDIKKVNRKHTAKIKHYKLKKKIIIIKIDIRISMSTLSKFIRRVYMLVGCIHWCMYAQILIKKYIQKKKIIKGRRTGHLPPLLPSADGYDISLLYLKYISYFQNQREFFKCSKFFC